MDLKRQISLTEKKYKSKLENYFKTIFTAKGLSSHGLEHHARVWHFSKEILSLKDIILPEGDVGLFTDKLIIAAYLHDSGMSIEPGNKHGIHSRVFCTEFLRLNNLNPEPYKDLLEAIEGHDDKDYRNKPVQSFLLNYLSVADDLDALGFIGIYRYLEIYLKRKVEFQDLGNLILKNAVSRFNNLSDIFSNYPSFILFHKKRFEILQSFCLNYTEHAACYRFGTETPEGFCGIGEIIAWSVNREMSLGQLLSSARSNKDKTINRYFGELTKESEFYLSAN